MKGSKGSLVTINLKGREIPLLYTTWEMKEIQEKIAPIGEAINMMLGKDNGDKEKQHSKFGSAEHLNATAKMVMILGNAGLEEAGNNPDLTEKKVLRAIKPGEIGDIVNACLDAMAQGMASEIPEKKQDGPVDVVLKEMEKKKERDG